MIYLIIFAMLSIITIMNNIIHLIKKKDSKAFIRVTGTGIKEYTNYAGGSCVI